MQTPPFLRVDDRLVHAQVVLTWVKALRAKSIWVVSDRAAAQPIEVMLLKNSAPPEISVEVLAVQPALHRWTQQPVDGLLILTEGLRDVVQLHDGGLPLQEVNLGGLRYRRGTIALNRAVYVDAADMETLRQMQSRNLPAFLAMLPSDKKVNVYERARRKWQTK